MVGWECLSLGATPCLGRTTASVVARHRPDASSEQFRAPGGTGMSIELILVIIVLLVAVGIATLRKVRTGSFAPWWWRGKGSRDS